MLLLTIVLLTIFFSNIYGQDSQNSKECNNYKSLIILISNSILDDFSLINHEYLVDTDYYDLKSGVNEYRLYSYLSTFYNNIKM